MIAHLSIIGKLRHDSILGRVVMKVKWAQTEISADHLTLVLDLLSVLSSLYLVYSKEISVYSGEAVVNRLDIPHGHADQGPASVFWPFFQKVMEIHEQNSVWVTKNHHFSPSGPGCWQSPSQGQVSWWPLQPLCFHGWTSAHILTLLCGVLWPTTTNRVW